MAVTAVLTIAASRLSGFAPHGIFVDSISSTSDATSRPFHDCLSVWSFGDPAGGATWSGGAFPGVMSKNAAYGPCAGHLFETGAATPIQYTTTLNVWDGGFVGVDSETISVQDADSFFSGANTICVRQAATGTFGGAPSGATQVTESSWVTAVSTYATDGKRVLFRNGDTWAAGSATLAPSGTTGGMVGSFGTDSAVNPIMQSSAGGNILTIGSAANPDLQNWVLMDLEFDGNASGDGITYGGDIDHVTYLRLHIHDMIDIGIEFVQQNVAGNHIPTGQYTVECHIHDIDDFAMIGGTYSQWLGGNNMHGCPAGNSHVFRNDLINKFAANNNDFGNGGDCMTLRGVTFTDSNNLYSAGTVSQYGYISFNYFYDGANNGSDVPMVSCRAASGGADQRTENMIFEGNYFDIVANRAGGGLWFGGSQMTARNNFFDSSSNTNGTYGIRGTKSEAAPDPRGLNIYNNTIVTAGTSTFGLTGVQFLSSCTNNGGADPNNIMSNLVYGPSESSVTPVSDGSSSATISGNTVNGITENPSFPTFPWATLNDAIPGTVTNGTAGRPVHTDGFRRSRYGVTNQRGAYQGTEGTYPWLTASTPVRKGCMSLR